MSVYRPKGCITYRYDFWYRGQRHRDTTHQTNHKDALEVETRLKGKLRRQAGGLFKPEDSPRFAEWAGVYYAYAETQLEAPQHVDDTLRVVLRFWGQRPGPNSKTKIEPDAPYHDLRLVDPIDDPDWIEAFEQWIAARGGSHQTRNHYFSIMSRLYRVAMLPKFRKHAGIRFNPFAGIPKLKTRPRNVTLTVPQILAWIRESSYHVRLAAAIAALAPKFRVRNILDLQWATNVDRQLHFITVHQHKTEHLTEQPMVAAVSAQLRGILKDARARVPTATHVVTYRGKAVKSIQGGVKAAFEAAKIPYGRDIPGGATFHTVRHSIATLLAELDETEAKRAGLMGQDPATTQRYTHLRPVQEKRIAERLSRAVKIADVVTRLPMRAARKLPVGIVGGQAKATLRKSTNSLGKQRQAK